MGGIEGEGGEGSREWGLRVGREGEGRGREGVGGIEREGAVPLHNYYCEYVTYSPAVMHSKVSVSPTSTLCRATGPSTILVSWKITACSESNENICQLDGLNLQLGHVTWSN